MDTSEDRYGLVPDAVRADSGDLRFSVVQIAIKWTAAETCRLSA